MRLASKIMSLPAAILLLISSHSNSALAIEHDQAPVQWPYNLPKHVKYWPEDPPNRRRDLEAIEEHLRLGRNPVGVMKMPADEGEKFYPEYWQFEGELEPSFMDTSTSHLRIRDEEEEAILQANTSAEILYRPPFALHTEHESNSVGYQDLRARKALEHRGAATALGILEKKQFACPNGTSDCSSIGYPNSCCATDETCFVIQDTGLGPVGCCPNGSSCGGTITNCNAPNTACADNLGGGCCIPNYVCAGVGCKSRTSLDFVLNLLANITQRRHKSNSCSHGYSNFNDCGAYLIHNYGSDKYKHDNNRRRPGYFNNNEHLYRSSNYFTLLLQFSGMSCHSGRRVLSSRSYLRLAKLMCFVPRLK